MEDFQLGTLEVRTNLTVKELIATTGHDQITEGISEEALSIIVPSLRENPLRVVQGC